MTAPVVLLSLPEGYVSYQWLQGATVVGTQPTYNATSGNYTAKVVEQFGCGALPSAVFTVVNAAKAILNRNQPRIFLLLLFR